MTVITINHARAIAGSLGYPSKMPGTAFGISAHACITGRRLARIKGSVCHKCYALKANYLYPSVAKAHETRLNGIDNALWVAAMVLQLESVHKSGRGRRGKRIARGWHRWHDSGDLQSVEHLAKICAVAKRTPKIKHWLPTRELGLVLKYRAAGGKIPRNLVIRVSATMVNGAMPKAWPTVSGVHDGAPAQGYSCPASKRKGKLKGKCGPCRACWDPAVKAVSYPLH